MSESFSTMLDDSLNALDMQPGSIVSGVVLDVDKDYVTIHVGLKSEGIVSLDEFKSNDGDVTIEVGDEVEVALEAVEDGYGETRISREKARKISTWKMLEEALETGEFVTGKINNRVKGGFAVEVDVVKAFLPGSLVDVRPVKEAPDIENTIQDFKVIKLDYKRNNVVLSRKAVLEKNNSAVKVELLKNLEEGQIVKGVVKNITDYGAFIDLGGLDGLLHITDISWSRVSNPSEYLNVGEEIDVKVLSFDKEKLRVSLGLKQINNDPWENVESNYTVGGIYEASVSNITDYGCFAQLEDGIEGLIHLSELDWTSKNIHPSKVVDMKEKIKVMILEIDHEKRRISLGLKQTKPNPWTEFANKYVLGDKVEGKIKSITDFGIFVGLEGDIDGLIHLSDISDEDDPKKALEEFKKEQSLECIIFAIDADKERISLKLSEK
jgi:small subunit ribosomal protein S1